jgi:predicted permease
MSVLSTVIEETRQAARGLWRARAFSVAAVLTLAIGIAGTAVMFALVHGLLLSPLPVHEQDRLIVAWKRTPSGDIHYPFLADAVAEVERHATLLESVAAFAYNGAMQFVAIEDGNASYISAGAVSGDFFRVLGTRALLGRTLEPGDDVRGAEPVLVIDEGLWRERYGARADVVGRRVRILSQAFRIVGVVPAVDLPRGAAAWMTIHGHLSSFTSPQAEASITLHHDLLARLRAGVTVDQARAELEALTEDYERRQGRTLLSKLSPVVRAYDEEVTGQVRPSMLVLSAAVVLVWLVACANLANLLLMRGESRRNEAAIRAALGAGRLRLARHVLVETLLVGALAGSVALLFSWWGLGALIAWMPTEMPRAVGAVRVDATMVAFISIVAMATAAGTGLSAAFLATPAAITGQLQSTRVAGPMFRQSRRALVIAQVALSIMILAAAGVLARTLLQLQSADMGVAADRLLFAELFLPFPEYEEAPRRRPFLQQLAREVAAIPGVEAVTPIAVRPYAGLSGWDTPRWVAEGQNAEQAATNPALDLMSIYPGHFDTLGIRTVSGRGITEADTAETPQVAVISENVARRVWRGQDPIGKRLKMGGIDSPAPWYTIVGVAETTRYRELAEPRASLYLAAAQFVDGAGSLAIRSAVPAEAIAGAIRERVQSADADVALVRLQTFSSFLAGPLARPRFLAWLSNLFGAVALLLAAIGLYAVMAAFVRQRNREIGVRVALGATSADVRRLVVSEAVWLAGIGVALGLGGSVATSGLLRGLLFNVGPLDPATLAMALAVLAASAALACYAPIRRATRVDPVALLRAE